MIDPTEWLHDFVLPLVAGGDVRVRGVLGAQDLVQVANDLGLSSSPVGAKLAEARLQVTAELWLHAAPPPLDAAALCLAVAVQNLLFLAHPGSHSLSVTSSRRQKVAKFAVATASLPPPTNVRELVERHSMVHHLFDLGRDDVRVSFWAGRREFRGAEPPARLLKWATVRRVREERWRVGVVAEAVADPFERQIVDAIVAASPLTSLLEPTRLEPRFQLLPVVRWLRDPEVARAVTERYLSLGVETVGPLYALSLLELYHQKEAQKEAQLATRFLCHLQLLQLLGEAAQSESTRRIRLETLVARKEQLRDFFGLFAAAEEVGLGRPPDVARDPRLSALIDSHTRLCAAVCGPKRVVELTALMGGMALAS
jgi:hypothetical protein